MLSNQPLPYIGDGCQYCRAGIESQDCNSETDYDKSGTVLIERYRCMVCKRQYSLRYVLRDWADEKGSVSPISIIEYTDMPLARAVYPELIGDILDRVQAGQSKYGCVLSTNNGRTALQDVYEELLDAVLYLKQLQMEEHDGLKSCFGKS